MPKWKIKDEQGNVIGRVEAPDAAAAEQLFRNGGSPVAPRPKGDPLLREPFLNPPAGETVLKAAGPESKLGPDLSGEPGSPLIDRIMQSVGALMPTPATAAGAAAGALPLKGGRIAQSLQRVGAGTGLGGLLGAGKALLMGEEVAPEMAVGAIGGGVGGIAAGATKAPLMPNKPTQQATAGVKALGGGEEWSPNVRGLLNPKDPAALYSRHTLRGMQQRSSKNIQNTLDALDQQYPDGITIQREMLDPKTKQPLGLKYPDKLSIKDAQKQIMDLRKQGADAEALHLERELVTSLGPLSGPEYQATMAQYARDARLIDYVTGVQKRVKLPGGVNPRDFPAAAQAEKALGGGANDSASYHAGMFAAHPTSPYGIAHGVGALGALMGKGAVDPAKVAPIGPLRRGAGMVIPPAAGGLAGQQVQGIFGLGSTE